MNFIAVILGTATIFLFVLHAFMHSFEHDPFFASASLSRSAIAANLSATASSLGTALLFLLFQTPVYGVLILLIILMYLLGQMWFAHIASRIAVEDKRYIGSIYRLIMDATGSRSISIASNALNVATYAVLLLIEVVLGSVILSYAIPDFVNENIFAVALIMLGVSVYVVIGGFQLVSSSDKWQFLFLLCGVILAIILFSMQLYRQEINLIEPVRVLFTMPEGSVIVTGSFIINVIVVNLLLPISQSASWQRYAAARNVNEFRLGFKRAIFFQLIWAWLAFAFLAAQFYVLNGHTVGSAPDLFNIIDSIGVLGSFFVGPILFAALVAAIVSTADSLLIALMLGIHDFRRAPERGAGTDYPESAGVSRRDLIVYASVCYIFVVGGYAFFASLAASEKSVIVGLMFTAVGQTVLLAPVVWRCAKSYTGQKINLDVRLVLVGLAIGFLVLWLFSIAGIRTGNIALNQIGPVVALLISGVFCRFAEQR